MARARERCSTNSMREFFEEWPNVRRLLGQLECYRRAVVSLKFQLSFLKKESCLKLNYSKAFETLRFEVIRAYKRETFFFWFFLWFLHFDWLFSINSFSINSFRINSKLIRKTRGNSKKSLLFFCKDHGQCPIDTHFENAAHWRHPFAAFNRQSAKLVNIY